MAAPTLEIHGFSRDDGSRRAACADTLRFEPGRITALAGPAGAGKTALMRLLAGLDRAGSERVTCDGAPISRHPPDRCVFGMVRQGQKLFPVLSLRENIALPLRLRRTRRSDREAILRGVLELTQLEDAANARPHEADPSQIARALLARACVCGPTVLLLDEPFGRAGEAFSAGLVSILRRVHEVVGTTTVLATRDVKLALPAGDRIAILRGGAPVQVGTPQDVYERPADPFVAMLAGECNCLDGTVLEMLDDSAIVQLACGPVVEASGTAGLAAGRPCRLLVRPEHIAVAPGHASDMGEGALDATLLEMQFWGESTRLRLLIGSGAEFLVRRPSGAGLRGLAPGRPVAIAWQSHHAIAYPN